MTLTPAESLKDTWASIFRRKGGDGVYTRLFDNLDPSQQRTLLAALTFHESELPVIGSVQDASNWLVLTTERLVWSRAGERQKVTVDAISSTAPDKSQLGPKPEMRQLQVVTIEGGKYSIELEPGRPLFGTWNVLNNAGTRNRNAIKRIKATQGE